MGKAQGRLAVVFSSNDGRIAISQSYQGACSQGQRDESGSLLMKANLQDSHRRIVDIRSRVPAASAARARSRPSATDRFALFCREEANAVITEIGSMTSSATNQPVPSIAEERISHS